MSFILGSILTVIGGAIIYFSWWLLLHSSDEKVQRRFRHSWRPQTIKEDEEAYLQANVAIVAVILMGIGTGVILAGVSVLFGVGWGKRLS